MAFARYAARRNGSSNSDIYVVDSKGTNLTALTHNPDTSETGPVFSPDGDRIAFVRQPGNGEPPYSEIYVVNADGTNQTNLTKSSEKSEDWPVFSPDGEKVAFVRTTSPEVSDVYVVNVDGTGLTRLTHHTGYDGQPAFIPGTDRVAFVSHRDGDDIYAVKLDGTGLTALTHTDSMGETNPSFSADGTKMAYASARYDKSDNLVYEIYVMDLQLTKMP